ncbi:MAG TPA: shikimate kinase AroK [Gammaproteobacteria bacterium]|nr:shikimate kinase AroK [Gammaproteobacteria bacterium]
MPETVNGRGKRIFLVGPMGAGKTTVGRRLAEATGYRFLDTDQEVERRTGVDISFIFDMEGEEGFRRRERKVLDELSRLDGIVLSTGGGAILDPDNRAMLNERGIVVYLETTVDEQMRRTRFDRRRPLLQTADPRARLTALLSERAPLYESVADLTIHTDGRRARSVARQIQRELGLPGAD